MAKATFDVKTEATRAFYAGVGVNDLAVEVVRDFVTTAQKTVSSIDLTPKSLRDQAISVVNARVDALAQDAKSRRAAIEARVTELQNENISAYGDLVQRGQSLVGRIRKQESSKATVSSARTTAAKAKTTKTQATKTAAARKTAAKRTATATKKKAATTQSSAKATVTAAKKTAADATKAVADAAEKVGD